MLSAQVTNGAGLPLVKYDHKAGQENHPDENDENSVYAKQTGHPSYRADDALWLFRQFTSTSPKAAITHSLTKLSRMQTTANPAQYTIT